MYLTNTWHLKLPKQNLLILHEAFHTSYFSVEEKIVDICICWVRF